MTTAGHPEPPPGPVGPVVCCDLDGVVWRGDRSIDGAAAGITALREAGLRVGFLSNNSSLTIDEVVAKLAEHGVAADRQDVLTSATAAAALLAQTLPAGSRVLVCGGPGIVEALTAVDLEAVSTGRAPEAGGPCAAVVVGLDRGFGYGDLARASDAIRAGAHFVATNDDATYPVPGGFLPGAGALVAAVAIASGIDPVIAGKPHDPAAALVRERFGRQGIMVGDRPSTDGAFATALGWPFALVLSGVAARDPGPGAEPIPDPAPPYLAEDLRALTPMLVTALT